MEVAMTQAGLSVQREVLLTVDFRDHIVGEFRADTLVDSRVILEYKTAVRAVEVAEAQLLNYLNCTDKEVGLLLKFFAKPSFKRCFLGNENKRKRRLPFVPRPFVSEASLERSARVAMERFE
jgi:GxxExxY protein